MAIVKMKKLRVIAMRQDREALLSALMDLGCVELSSPEPAAFADLMERGTSHASRQRTLLTDANTALEAVKRLGEVKDGPFIKRRKVTKEEFFGGEELKQGEEACARVNEALQTMGKLKGEADRIQSAMAALRPWAGLDLPLEQTGTAKSRVRLGVFSANTDTGTARNALAAEELAAELLEVNADRQQRYLCLIVHKEEEGAALEVLRPFAFSAVTFPDHTGTAAENLDRLERQLTENRAQQEQAEAVIRESAPNRSAMRLYADHLNAALAREQGAEQLLEGENILYFSGWAPAERMEEVTSLLDGLGCAWKAEDPAPEEYPEVPIQLQNNPLTEPMNMVTEMYSLPAYDGVDPNPLMAPFFVLFFGLMLADMGYGLLMILVSAFIKKKYDPKGTMGQMFGIGILCGVSTFFWGALTGGFFGDFIPQLLLLINPGSTFALPALFTPLNDALMVLIGSLALGLVQIFTGMAVSIWLKVKRGQVMSALCGEVAWYAVFLCIALGAVTGKWSAFLILALVILLLTQGYGKKGIAGKLMGIGGSLYNGLTGYFSDILSYSRLMALMLAGAVIAQVFNTLGAITGNVFIFLVISFLGNALNFGLNLLGCYVHALRLQCLEYFGRFYEDGGKPFRPLAAQTKYVDIT